MSTASDQVLVNHLTSLDDTISFNLRCDGDKL
jgi:hypothetical protein